MMIRTLKIIAAFFKVEAKNTFIYRGMLILWLLGWLLSFITMIFLWRSAQVSGGSLAGFTGSQIVTYYFIGMLVWQVCGWFTYDVAARHIQDGGVINFIVKPISFHWYRFGAELAWHVVNVGLFLGVMLGLFAVFHQYLVLSVSLNRLGLFALALIIACLVTFEFNLWMATSAFWLTRAAGLGSLYWLLLTLLGGEMVPLAFFPEKWQLVVNYLPFRFMYAFPIELYLGKLSFEETLISFCLGVVWIGVFAGLFRFFWQKGLKVYTGFGQ